MNLRPTTLLAVLPLLCGSARAADISLPSSALPSASPVRIAPAISIPAAPLRIERVSFVDASIQAMLQGAEPPKYRFEASPRRAAGGGARLSPAAEPETEPGPLIDSALWASLEAPSADALAWLAQRVPRLKRDAVRELPFDKVDALLTEAVARGDSALDVFTDEGLSRRGQLYYLSQETLQKVFAKYRLFILSRFSGKAKDGGAFQLEALVMGAGKIELLYDRDDFEFDNPDFKDHSYRSAERVTETIQGPGDLKVEGLSVAMFMHPRIERFVKVDGDKLRVETNWASEERPNRKIAARK